MMAPVGLTDITFGPVTVYVWGLFIALGVFIASVVGRRAAVRLGLSVEHLDTSVFWMVIGGLIGARLMHVYGYEPSYFLSHPLEILMVWKGGMSSTGGMVGGIIAWVWYVRRAKISMRAYADVIAYAMPIGWMIGRIGCFVTHTHPGILIQSCPSCGLVYPDGIRLELSSIEALWWFCIALIFFLVPSMRIKKSFAITVVALYAPFRFGLDFFRSEFETRYAGLTPAQYVMIALCVVVVTLWIRERARLQRA